MIFNMRAKEVLGVIESDSTELVGSYDSALKINKIGGVCEQTADERNLFKFESLTAPTNGVLALHQSGVVALLENYTFIGTANSYDGCVVTVANPIKGNGLYSNLFVISGSYTGTIKHKAVDSNGNETTAVAIGTALSLNSTKEYTRFVIAFEEGAVCTDLVLGFKVSKTDYNTFTPYIENVPSPDYPVEIKNSVVSEIKTHSNQLFDISKAGTGYIGDTGNVVASTINALSDYIRVDKNGFTISFRESMYNVGIATYDANKTFISRKDLGAKNEYIIAANSNVHYVRAWMSIDNKYIEDRLGAYEPMINLGATALPYEPYKESVITLSQPIELYSDGAVQDVIENGKVIRKYEKNTLPKTGWLFDKVTENYIEVKYGAKIDNYKQSSDKKLMCTHISRKGHNRLVYVFNCFYMRIELSDTMSSFEDAVAFLSNNDVEYLIELSTPVIEDLSLTDQIALSCLKTFHGVTYVEFDGEVQPTLNSDYATNLEGAITLQAQADNKIGKANTLVNRAEGESDIFEVRVEHGLVYLYKDDVLHGVLGANNVITNGETYKTMNVRAEEDADFIALTNKKTNSVCYYMNINQIPFTSNEYTEPHYFGGDMRLVGDLKTTGNIEASDWLFSKNVQISEYLKSKYIEINETLTTKTLKATNIKIGDGAAQPVEWVWDSTLGRWVLCSINVDQQGE